jgi:Family of unknown function (DUF6599)
MNQLFPFDLPAFDLPAVDLSAVLRRTLGLSCLAWALTAQAAVWPEQFAGAKLLSAKPAALSDQQLWTEYGLQESEQADYGKFKTTAYRLQDPTAAMAAFDWQRPAEARKSELGKLAVATSDGALLVHGNYLLKFEGIVPKVDQVGAVIQSLARLDQSPLPALPDELPSQNLVANSTRYVIGPVSLNRFAPQVPPSVAALHLGTEAAVGTFTTPSGEIRMALFSYPTPNIARERLVEFQKLSGTIAKRSGPLVAVALNVPNPDDAEKLLALVKYQASISWNEYVPTRRDNIGDLILTIFELTGVLILFAAASGLAFGWFRVLVRKANKNDEEVMISLGLNRN